jgi:hypothetical protein
MGEEIHVDFNTGSGGREGSSRPPGEPGRPPPRVSGGASGGEFDYSDPIQSFISTAQAVAFRPVDFFRGVRRQGDFINPLIFALICVLVSAVLGGLIGFLFNIGLSNQGAAGALVGFFTGIIQALISVLIGLFVGAGIWHLLVLLFLRPRHEGYEATFRVAAYSTVVYLVSWIPILGWILSLYGIYLGIVGIREVHGTTTGKAALIVLLPIAVIAFFILLIVIVLGIGAAIFFGTQQ